jgi:hypothetical protein
MPVRVTRQEERAMSEKIRAKVYDAIQNSPDVKEGNYVNVTLRKTGFLGFGKAQLELSGRAASEKDKTRIEEIAKGASEGLEVISNIRLGRTG